MGHPGKHIIDPETGLCVICDKEAIQEVTQGRRPEKQYIYPNQNDEAPYQKDRYVYEARDEARPSYARKTVYPAPTVRSRRVLYEQPIEQPLVIRRKVIRRDPVSPEDVILHRQPPPRSSAYYYVDDENQMVPQNRPPPVEPPRHYVVRKRQSPPPVRTVRVVRQPARTPTPPPARRVRVIREPAQTPTPPPPVRTVVHVTREPAQTPPPPPSEPWHTGPRRQTNSNTEIVEQEQPMRHDDRIYSPVSSIKPEMYYIEGASDHDRQSPLESPAYMPRTPTPKPVYQGNRNRKPNKIEPFKQQNPPPPETTVVKRVYKKPVRGKQQPLEDEYIPDENQPHPVRKLRNYTPPPKHHQSTPTYTNGNNRSPVPTKNPTVFYIRNTDEYE